MTDMLMDLEAERSILGAIILEPALIGEAAEQLEARHFGDPVNARIFGAMRTLFERGDGIDPVTLRAQLGSDLPESAKVIGALIDGLPRATSLADWLAIVLDRARRRAAHNLGRRLMEQAQDEKVETGQLLDRHQSSLVRLIEITSAGTLLTMGDALKQAFADIDEFVKGSGIVGIPSGFPDLDEVTNGWQPDRLVIIAARPGVGKSTWLNQIVMHAGQKGFRGLVFSMEMQPKSTVERMLYSTAEVERWDLKVKETAWARMANAYGILGKHPTLFDDRETPTMAQIRSRAQTVHKRHKLDYIVVDYLQRVAYDPKLEQRIGVGQTAMGLKSLARQLKVPVIVACQLNRASESREPTLADLAQSGQIECEADIIAFLHPDAETKSVGHDQPITHLIMGKHRQGACRRFRLGFQKRYGRFVPMADYDVLEDSALPRGDRASA